MVLQRLEMGPHEAGVVRRNEKGAGGGRREEENPRVQVGISFVCCLIKFDTSFYRYLHDAKATLAGRLFIRMLGACIVQDNDSILSMARSPKGRPYFTGGGGQDWDFNVSHQGSFVVLAAERDDRRSDGAPLQVGVDVMKLTSPQEDLNRFFRLMRRQFTSAEWEQIRREEEQLKTFYRHWCLKESFVKADGRGLNWELQRLSFQVRYSGPDGISILVQKSFHFR